MQGCGELVDWCFGNAVTYTRDSLGAIARIDAAGRVTSLDPDAAPAITYAYDLAGRLASLTLPGAATATFTHDAAGAHTSAALPNSALTSYAYDSAGRIASIVTTSSTGVIAERYTRDAKGRVTSDSNGTYAYDATGRLISWTAPSGAVTTYTYDAASNLTGASTDGSATASFEVDAADRITSPGFTYDDAGNLTSDGTRTFTYDAACRLVAVADASTETTIATFTYDAFNRRVSSTEGTATVFFHYDGASARVIAETDSAGATIATYAYDPTGALFSMTREGETYYYHTNARGDVVALSDSTGAVVNTYAYDPWGTLLSASETVPNPYRYASYRYDASTGLYYCWNRYYAPELARFLTRDIYPGELSDPVTMNPYLYCGGDPVNLVDPNGRVAFVAGAAIATAVIVIGAAVVGGLSFLFSAVKKMEVMNEALNDGGLLYSEYGDYARENDPDAFELLDMGAQTKYQVPWAELTSEQKGDVCQDATMSGRDQVMHSMSKWVLTEKSGLAGDIWAKFLDPFGP